MLGLDSLDYCGGVDVLYGGYTRPYDGNNRGIIYLHAAQAGTMDYHYGEGDLGPRWFSRRGLHDTWFQATAQCDGAAGRPDCPPNLIHTTIEI